MKRRRERRNTSRIYVDGLYYARIYVKLNRHWALHDTIVMDLSETHIRVCSDLPLADEYRICRSDAEDICRSIEIRRDGAGAVFEFGEPVERPEVREVISDLSFLEPHYAFKTTVGA